MLLLVYTVAILLDTLTLLMLLNLQNLIWVVLECVFIYTTNLHTVTIMQHSLTGIMLQSRFHRNFAPASNQEVTCCDRKELGGPSVRDRIDTDRRKQLLTLPGIRNWVRRETFRRSSFHASLAVNNAGACDTARSLS